MDTEECAHIESLLQTHRAHLHVLEQQEATLILAVIDELSASLRYRQTDEALMKRRQSAEANARQALDLFRRLA